MNVELQLQNDNIESMKEWCKEIDIQYKTYFLLMVINSLYIVLGIYNIFF